ncbi:hypothetical protein F2P81_004504, partial [Scophthalmus maximus]
GTDPLSEQIHVALFKRCIQRIERKCMKERKLKNKENYDVTLTRIEQTDEKKILSTATVSGTEANQRYECIDAVAEHAQQAKIETCKPLAVLELHDGIFMYFDHTLCTPGKPLTCSVA